MRMGLAELSFSVASIVGVAIEGMGIMLAVEVGVNISYIKDATLFNRRALFAGMDAGMIE